MPARSQRIPLEIKDVTVLQGDKERSGKMNLSNRTRPRTTSEVQGEAVIRSRPKDDLMPASRARELGLDLRDIMLDLDPGMLGWTPPRTR